jgi:hypothetical protein
MSRVGPFYYRSGANLAVVIEPNLIAVKEIVEARSRAFSTACSSMVYMQGTICYVKF